MNTDTDLLELDLSDNGIGNNYYKHFFSSCFHLLVIVTSSIGIFMFSSTLLNTIYTCALNFLWILTLVGVYAFYQSKEEKRYLLLKERYVNLKLVRAV
jgi:hypothetical protein